MHPSFDNSLDTRPDEPPLLTRFAWSAACGAARGMTSSGTQPEGPFDVVSTAVTRANASTAGIVDDLRTPIRERRRPSPTYRKGPLTWANARVGGYSTLRTCGVSIIGVPRLAGRGLKTKESAVLRRLCLGWHLSSVGPTSKELSKQGSSEFSASPDLASKSVDARHVDRRLR